MNKRLFYKIVVLDEIIKHKIEQNNIIINEKQENYIKNVLKEQEQGEKEEEAKKSQGFLDKIKSKGIFGTYNDAVTGLMNNYMKLMFGAGAFQNDDQANKAMADMAATKDPEKALDKMQKDTDKVADYLSTTPRAETPEVNRMIQRLMAASANIEKVEDKIEDAPEQADAGDKVPKETPMSVMKKQKDVVVGQGGQKEAPLVMHIQKMGLSQSTAQAIAKRVGKYLQQRDIPIAEVVKRLDEATDVSRIKSSIFGKMRLVTGKNVKPETKKREASYVLAIHNVAKSKNPEKFRKFLMKRYGGAADIKEMPEEDIKQLMQYVLTSPEFKKYHKASFDYRQGRAAEKEKGRQSVRALGKDKGVIGKIVSRFVRDNQQLINKDPAIKATLDDPVKYNKLSKSIRNMLRRQLKRRGYEADEIKNLLSESNSEKLKEALAVSIKPLIEKLIRQQLKDSNGN